MKELNIKIFRIIRKQYLQQGLEYQKRHKNSKLLFCCRSTISLDPTFWLSMTRKDSQQRLFNLKQWHKLLEQFSFLKLQPSCLSKQVFDTICIVKNCCQSEGDMTSALAYTKALKDQAERAEDVLSYKIVKHSLKLLRDYPLMLIKNPQSTIPRVTTCTCSG